MRTDRYKLIHYYQNDEWELFDLKEDPQDLKNLYGAAGYTELTDDLVKRLKSLREQYQVPENDPEAPWYHGPMIRVFEQLLKLK